MCGRFTLRTNASELLTRETRAISLMRWGLVPNWSKDAKATALPIGTLVNSTTNQGPQCITRLSA